MMFWIIGIYIILGVMVNLFVLYKEPILLYAGWWLIPYFVIGTVIFPYVLISFLTSKDKGGSWI